MRLKCAACGKEHDLPFPTTQWFECNCGKPNHLQFGEPAAKPAAEDAQAKAAAAWERHYGPGGSPSVNGGWK